VEEATTLNTVLIGHSISETAVAHPAPDLCSPSICHPERLVILSDQESAVILSNQESAVILSGARLGPRDRHAIMG
jgi:hypothetical protein